MIQHSKWTPVIQLGAVVLGACMFKLLAQQQREDVVLIALLVVGMLGSDDVQE